MSSHTRYVLLGGGAVLLVGLLTGGVAYLQGGIPAFAVAQPGRAELKYVPAEASLIFYASVRDVMQSNLRERLGAAQPDPGGQRRFLEGAGVNLEEDIDHVVAGFVSIGEERPAGVVLLTGRFDQSRLESFAREHGDAFEGQSQLVDATNRLNTSDAFIQPNVCRGRLLSWRATAFNSARV